MSRKREEEKLSGREREGRIVGEERGGTVVGGERSTQLRVQFNFYTHKCHVRKYTRAMYNQSVRFVTLIGRSKVLKLWLHTSLHLFFFLHPSFLFYYQHLHPLLHIYLLVILQQLVLQSSQFLFRQRRSIGWMRIQCQILHQQLLILRRRRQRRPQDAPQV